MINVFDFAFTSPEQAVEAALFLEGVKKLSKSEILNIVKKS